MRLAHPALLLQALTSACTPDPDDTGDCDLHSVDRVAAYNAVIEGTATPCQIEAWEDHADMMVLRERGPWNGEVRVAASADGLDFDLDSIQNLITYGGVPEVVLHDGVYYMFYLDGDPDWSKTVVHSGSDWFATHGLGPFGAMRMATSTDAYHFEPVEAFGIEDLVPAMVADPDVIQLPDGRWRLYYLSVPIPDFLNDEIWQEGTPHNIDYAESDDLVHWERKGTAVVGPFADPTVRCRDDGECLMMSYGLDRSTSTDGGASFEYHGGHEIFGFAPDFLDIEGGPLRMYVNSRVHGAPIISFTLDADGETWDPDPEERLPNFTGEAPTVAPAPNDGWLMYYHMDWDVEGWG